MTALDLPRVFFYYKQNWIKIFIRQIFGLYLIFCAFWKKTLIFHFYQSRRLARQWVCPSCLGGQCATRGLLWAWPPSRMSSPSLWAPTPSCQASRASVSTPPSPSSPSTPCKSPTLWLGSVLVKKSQRSVILEITKETNCFPIFYSIWPACWLAGYWATSFVFVRSWN